MKVFQKNHKPSEEQKKEHRCLFVIKVPPNDSRRCNLVFSSNKKLIEHKKQQEHLVRKSKKKDKVPTQKTKLPIAYFKNN